MNPETLKVARPHNGFEGVNYHAPHHVWSGQAERDWKRYAERAAAYAFGMAGDVRLARSVFPHKQKSTAVPPGPEELRPDRPRPRMG
jgi:hypothetical protein